MERSVNMNQSPSADSDNVAVAQAGQSCPGCGSKKVTPFYEASDVPVQSCLLLSDKQEALQFPVGKISLALCENCGFIYNTAFDPRLLDYTRDYEEQQSFSPRFNRFAEELTRDLVDRYNLRDKTIVEIGCGKGDFLLLLCAMGNNRGVGIDPSYVPGRTAVPALNRVTFIPDFYSERYADREGDFVCCRHTLEHIPDTAAFLRMVRRSLDHRPDTVVFFEVPDVDRVLHEGAFWDVYYEHCSYFTLGSLGRLFRECGFEVLNLYKGFDNQYLMIEARPTNGSLGLGSPKDSENSILDTISAVNSFAEHCGTEITAWKTTFAELRREGRRVVIWGSGSKCVGFLSSLDARQGIEFVVDINPHRHGKYLAGSGIQIESPEFLQRYKPDTVVIMNPIYTEEIRKDLNTLGLNPHLLSV
jgi:SAM-dependent methyltransferase